MAYQVRISSRAWRDLAQLFDNINAADSEAAQRWYGGLRHSILSWKNFPTAVLRRLKIISSGTFSMAIGLMFIA